MTSEELLVSAGNAARSILQAMHEKPDDEVISTDTRSLRGLATMLAALCDHIEQHEENCGIGPWEDRIRALVRRELSAHDRSNAMDALQQKISRIDAISSPVDGDLAILWDPYMVLREVRAVLAA